MAIEVGVLSLAIETNAANVTNQLKQLDRELKRVSADQSALSSQAQAASKLETQVKREMLAAQKELNRLSKASKTSDADIQARAAAQARLNQLTKDYAEAKRLAAVADTASVANRQRRDALRAEVADTKQAVKEMESERKASDARVRTHQAGLGKAHVATIRAEGRAEVEERRRQSAMQRDIDKRIGVDRQRMDRVMYAQRQTMYNELFVAETSSAKRAERERVRSAKQADREIAASRKASEGVSAALSARLAKDSAMRQRLMLGDPSRGGRGFSLFGIGATTAGMGAAYGLLRTANDFQLVQQRLAQVAETGDQIPALFDRMAKSSQRLRVPIADATELFVKLRQSNAMLGLSFGETAQITDAFSAALRISGATGQTASSALLQFGQAMAKGTLDGDEFRTMAENNSEVLRVLERQLGVTRGEVLKMREEKKLTAKMLADSLIKEYDLLIARVEKLKPTMSQAAISFRNSIMMMIANSKDANEAMDTLAQKIVSIGDTLQSNGAVIVSLTKWIALIGSGTLAVRGLQSALALLARNPLMLVGAAVVTPFVARDLAEASVRDARRSRISDMVDEGIKSAEAFEEMTDKVVKAQVRYNKAMEAVRSLAMGPVAERIGATQEANREVNAARDALRELSEAHMQAAKSRAILQSGGSTVTDPTRTEDAKAAKDTTDQFLSAMKALADEGVDVSRGMERLYAIMASAQSVVDNQKSGIIELAEAKERLARANELLLVIEGFGSEDMQEASAQIRDMNQFLARHIELLDEMGRVGPEQITQLRDALTEARAALAAIDPEGDMEGFEEQADVVQRLANAWEFLTKKYGQFLQAGEKATNKPFQEQISSLDRYYRNVERQILTTLLDAPSDLVTSYFDALGQSVVDGGVNVGEKMRQAFASIFSNIGSNLIRDGFARLSKELLSRYGKMMLDMGASTTVFGKFLTAIKAAISNPLIAGPALIAVGAAMVAYSAKMGAIGRGSSGGDFGGGLGGLNVGRDPAPIIYRLGDRPMQSRVMNGDPSQSGQSVVVNATIIGPNDPRAQRDIATLVDNAARRGLLQGAGVRT